MCLSFYAQFSYFENVRLVVRMINHVVTLLIIRIKKRKEDQSNWIYGYYYYYNEIKQLF